MLCAGLQQSITAAGGSVRVATASAAILRNGLGSLRISLLVADSDIQTQAIDLAQTFGLPLLIVARTMTAAYRAAELTEGVVVDPVSPGTMAEALHTVAAGKCYRDTLLETILKQTGLTKTEQEVGRLVLQGLKDEEIAARLVQQRQTVRTHLMHLYSKLEVHSRDAFIAWAETERVAQRGR
jgi:DNA-binding NarL/FixJ family response regulator